MAIGDSLQKHNERLEMDASGSAMMSPEEHHV
jgi:hypothetical protein